MFNQSLVVAAGYHVLIRASISICVVTAIRGFLHSLHSEKRRLQFQKIAPETVNGNRDLSLTVHFLYQCHMGFAMPPPQETGSSLESIHFYRKIERDHRLWPTLSPYRHQDTYWTHFSQDTYVPNILTQKCDFFRHKNQDEINFVRDLLLSQQHTLTRSGNPCFPSCATMDINKHLNSLIGETMN